MGADPAIDMPFLTKARPRKCTGFGALVRRKHSNYHNQGKEDGVAELSKQLDVSQLVAIGVGATIGAGVYVLVGTVARDKSGPCLSVAFLIAGIAAALSALCYAELASRCPSAGSAYHYAYTCVGEGTAWIIGWALILEYTLGSATVARGISPNLGIFFGGEGKLPFILTRFSIPGTSIMVDPCAGFLVVAVTVLLCVGIKESVTVQSIMTVLNCCVLMFVIVVGTWLGFQTGWPGYKQVGGFMPFGVSGLLGGAATVFFAFIGFDTVASTAEEVKNPQRDLPLGIGLAFIICSSLYMAVSAVIVGIEPYQLMDPDTPMSKAFSNNGMPWATYIIAGGAIAALSTALMGSLIPQPRILMAMSRDGLLPPFFSKLHKSIPVFSTIATGIVAATLASLMDVDELSGMVSVGTLLAFTIVCISVLILRYVPPNDTSVSRTASFKHDEFSPVKSYPTKKVIPAHLAVQSIEEYSPIISMFSEASMGTSVEDDKLSISSSSSSEDLADLDGNTESEVLESDRGVLPRNDLILGGSGIEGKKDRTRRKVAATSICAICIGVLLFCLGTSVSLFPSWFCWTIACLGLPLFLAGSVVLFFTHQDEGRHEFGQSGGFICPFVPILPIISILVNVYLLVNLESLTWIRVSIWLAFGVVLYFSYGIRHSVLSKG